MGKRCQYLLQSVGLTCLQHPFVQWEAISHAVFNTARILRCSADCFNLAGKILQSFGSVQLRRCCSTEKSIFGRDIFPHITYPSFNNSCVASSFSSPMLPKKERLKIQITYTLVGFCESCFVKQKRNNVLQI